MNEPQSRSNAPTPTAGPVDPEFGYRPISGWALAGFAVSAIFTVLVAISTTVALVQGAPFFYPMWIIGAPVVGIILSLYAQWQIQESEGTRAGAKLARLGIWLSLVSGLGYLSYFYVTGLALEAQADAFLRDKAEDSGFFPRLIESAKDPVQLNVCYLLTLPPEARSGRPEDLAGMEKMHNGPSREGVPGALTQFRENPLVRMLYKDLGKDAEITPMEVQEWKYEARSYKIYRNYRIKTKEIDIEVRLAVFSAEADTAGKERKWFLNLKESYPLYPKAHWTATGNGVRILRESAGNALKQEFKKLHDGLPWPNFSAIDHSKWNQVFMRDASRDATRKRIYDFFGGGGAGRVPSFNVMQNAGDLGKWEIVDGKVRIALAFRATLKSPEGGMSADGVAVLSTKQAVDPAQVQDASFPVSWEVIEIQFFSIGSGLSSKKA